MTALKLTQIGNSVGVILPKEMLARANLQEGDKLHVAELADGSFSLSARDPNFARGMQVPINESFKYLKNPAVTGSVITAGYVVGSACLLIAFIALWGMKETFDRDVDYVEDV